MQNTTEAPFEADEMKQCGNLTGDTRHACTAADGHEQRRHVEHDQTTHEPAFGWRGDAYSAFHLTVDEDVDAGRVLALA